MTRFDLYVPPRERSRPAPAWPPLRVFLWLVLCGALAFWATVLWTAVLWTPH